MTNTGTWYREVNPNSGRTVGKSHFARTKDFTTLCGVQFGDFLTSVGVDEKVCPECKELRDAEIAKGQDQSVATNQVAVPDGRQGELI